MSRLLDVLMRLAPLEFRRYGPEIRHLVTVRSREIRATAGVFALGRFWLFQISDIVRNIVAEWRADRSRQRSRNSNEKDPQMSRLIRDIGHAVRALVRDRAFTAIAVVTLALGIGASTTVFSVVNGVLLRPLPYQNSDRLVALWTELPGFGFPRFPRVTDALFVHYGDQSRVIQSLAGWRQRPARLLVDGKAERILGADVSISFFSTLGVAPQIGRGFVEEDAMPGSAPVAVLSHEAWTARFGAVPDIVGRMLDIDGVATEVVGVMPRGFQLVDTDIELLGPLQIDRGSLGGTSFAMRAVGRLAPGYSVEDASVEIGDLLWTVSETDPSGFFNESTLGQGQANAGVDRLIDDVVGPIRSTLWVLLGTVGLVLLIACANVANLALVRAEARGREITLRVALGAGRARIVRMFLTESAVLGVAAGVVGLGLGYLSTRAVVAFGPTQLPRLDDIRIDATVTVFSLLVALLSGLLFGTIPAIRQSRPDLTTSLQQESRSGTSSRSKQRIRAVLVSTQVALALVLLIGSGLMVRSMVGLSRVDPGFKTSGVLTFGLAVPPETYSEPESVVEFFREVEERLRGLPGVAAVGASSRLPLFVGSGTGVRPEGFEIDPDQLPPIVYDGLATPGFLESIGMQLISGRTFHPGEQSADANVVIVSRKFVDRFWPEQDAVGKRIGMGAAGDGESARYATVVGVVGDVRGNGLREEPVAQIYQPFDGTESSLVVQVAVSGDVADVLPLIRREVALVDRNVPVTNVQTIDQVLSDSLASTMFTMTMLAVAAFLALILGAVGVYGVISYVVSLRTREIGVRMALGARRWDVGGMVLRQGAAVAAVGLVVGVGAAIGLTRLLGSLLYGVEAVDVLTFVVAVLIVGAIALAASYLPAIRATRVDPLDALRSD